MSLPTDRQGRSSADFALPCQRIRFGAGEDTIAAITVGTSDTEGEARLLVEPSQLNWGKAETLNAARCRPYGDYGGRYRHAPFVMEWPPDITSDRWVELVIVPSPSDPIEIDAFDAAEQCYQTLARVPADAAQQWRTIRAALIQEIQQPTMDPADIGIVQEPPEAGATAGENDFELRQPVTVEHAERYG